MTCYFCKKSTNFSGGSDSAFVVNLDDEGPNERVAICKKCKEVIRAIAQGEAYIDYA